MAIDLQTKPNVDAPDSDYPFGKIRDRDGAVNGTPVNTEVYGDFHQFFAKLMDAAALAYNGFPDNDYSGFQYFDALLKNVSQRITTRTGTNFNNERNPGIFRVTGAFTNKPTGFEAAQVGQLIVSVEGDIITQTVVQFSTGAEWVRISSDGGDNWGSYLVTRYARVRVPFTWDMDTDATKALDSSVLKPIYFDANSIKVFINANGGGGGATAVDLLDSIDTATGEMEGGISSISVALGQLFMWRRAGGQFDAAAYNDGLTRGWIAFEFNPDSNFTLI